MSLRTLNLAPRDLTSVFVPGIPLRFAFLAFFSLMGDQILLRFAPYLPWLSFQYAPPSQQDGIELETIAPTHTLKSFIYPVSLPPLTLSLACQLPLLAFQLPLTLCIFSSSRYSTLYYLYHFLLIITPLYITYIVT